MSVRGRGIVGSGEGGETRLGEGILLESDNDWRLTFSKLTVP